MTGFASDARVWFTTFGLRARSAPWPGSTLRLSRSELDRDVHEVLFSKTTRVGYQSVNSVLKPSQPIGFLQLSKLVSVWQYAFA